MPSFLVDVLRRHREDADLLRLSAGLSELAALSGVLGRLPDPRRVRGRRYRPGHGHCLPCVCSRCPAVPPRRPASPAVPSIPLPGAGAGIGPRRPPRATTLGRLLSDPDGDALDDAVAPWPARHAGDPAGEVSVELVGVAVDGKAVRGSRTGEKTAVHLLAPVPHERQVVVSQRQTAARSDEIPAYAPLMEQLDLRGCVVTADATPPGPVMPSTSSPGAGTTSRSSGAARGSSADSCGIPVNGATPGGLRVFLAQVAFTWVCTQSVISRVGVPGVNTAATPRSSNSAMSRSGMMPPPNTGMSAASSSRSSCRTSSKSVI